jgi:hypothetical protein
MVAMSLMHTLNPQEGRALRVVMKHIIGGENVFP